MNQIVQSNRVARFADSRCSDSRTRRRWRAQRDRCPNRRWCRRRFARRRKCACGRPARRPDARRRSARRKRTERALRSVLRPAVKTVPDSQRNASDGFHEPGKSCPATGPSAIPPQSPCVHEDRERRKGRSPFPRRSISVATIVSRSRRWYRAPASGRPAPRCRESARSVPTAISFRRRGPAATARRGWLGTIRFHLHDPVVARFEVRDQEISFQIFGNGQGDFDDYRVSDASANGLLETRLCARCVGASERTEITHGDMGGLIRSQARGHRFRQRAGCVFHVFRVEERRQKKAVKIASPPQE